MRIALATSRFPWPIIHGLWLRVYHLARHLSAQDHEVSLLSFPGPPESVEQYHRVGVEVLDGCESKPLGQGPGKVALAPYVYQKPLAEQIARNAQAFDLVVLFGSQCIQYAPDASAHARVLADMVDDPILEYRRGRWKGLTGVLSPWRFRFELGQKRLERACREHVDIFSFVSQEDVSSFAARNPGSQTVFLPNGVDVEYFSDPQPGRKKEPEQPKIVFTGHMSNANNQAAALFLVDKIAPLLWQKHPYARIQIVGADPPRAVLDLACRRVEVTGRVEDLRPYLWNATAACLCMQGGTGIKNKLLEAWAGSAPVVASPVACQGVPYADGENLLLAESASAFAAKLSMLIEKSELARKVGQAGRAALDKGYTWDSVAAKLASLCPPGLENHNPR